MKHISRKYITFIMLGIIAMALAISLTTYALFFRIRVQDSTNVVSSLACLKVAFISETESISIDAAYPMSVSEGRAQAPFTFEIKNECDNFVEYQILATVVNLPNRVADNYVRYVVNDRVPNNISNAPTYNATYLFPNTNVHQSYRISSGGLRFNNTNTYDFRMWLDGSNESIWTDESLRGKEYQIKISVVAVVKPEPGIVTPTDLPIDLPAGMIPIAFDNEGRTIKANSDNNNTNWYDYSEFKWANAVLVNNTSRPTHQNSVQGTLIPEADILAYYVWIPRFSYELFNTNDDGDTFVPERMLNVTLQNKFDTKHQGNQNGQELTHPAFLFGDDELNGFWVGKFEMTGTTTNPTVLPSTHILGSQGISSAWTAIKSIENQASYGLSNSKMNSHMIKNMEWGAVTYLTNSQFGQRNNPIKTIREVFQNPSNEYITGRSGNFFDQWNTADVIDAPSSTLWGWDGRQCSTKNGFVCTGTRHATNGMAASTTGNQYGIYDMAAGGNEYVMGNIAASNKDFLNYEMNPVNAGTTFGSFNNTTLPKRYFEIYDAGLTSFDAEAFRRGFLGDATKEIFFPENAIACTWFGKMCRIPTSNVPWFIRGGGAVSSAVFGGIWASDAGNGIGGSMRSTSRGVLAYIP